MVVAPVKAAGTIQIFWFRKFGNLWIGRISAPLASVRYGSCSV